MLGWDSAGGTVTHNLTMVFCLFLNKIGALFDLHVNYAFVSFSSEVPFWRTGKREGQLFQTARRSSLCFNLSHRSQQLKQRLRFTSETQANMTHPTLRPFLLQEQGVCLNKAQISFKTAITCITQLSAGHRLPKLSERECLQINMFAEFSSS